MSERYRRKHKDIDSLVTWTQTILLWARLFPAEEGGCWIHHGDLHSVVWKGGIHQRWDPGLWRHFCSESQRRFRAMTKYVYVLLTGISWLYVICCFYYPRWRNSGGFWALMLAEALKLTTSEWYFRPFSVVVDISEALNSKIYHEKNMLMSVLCSPAFLWWHIIICTVTIQHPSWYNPIQHRRVCEKEQN